MNDASSQFGDAMRAAGLEPPDVIEPGKLQRFPGVGKRNGNTAGWCKMFDDGLGGCFGDWSTGLSETWQLERDEPFSVAEKEHFRRYAAEARAQAEGERQAQQRAAATHAAAIWNAAIPAPADHPYLVRKAIQPHGARLHQGTLLIPVRESNELHSLQFIGPGGEKRFLGGGRVAGGYFSIGDTQDATALCIAEGFATGATIHEATGHPVAVAFNAGNLKLVAQAMRARFPDLPLIVCADDDADTEGNPGLSKATEAARSVGGLLTVPEFGPRRPDGATDFNDLAAVRGTAAVIDAMLRAAPPDDATRATQTQSGHIWPEPQPLAARVEPEPYPLDALPDIIRAAVEEVQGFTKAPVALVASSALAALSLAIQAHADAKRAEKLTGPVSLYLLTIADSGERKSTCDAFFTKAIREYEENQAEIAKPMLRDYKAAVDVWDAKRSGIKDKIRQLANAGKPTGDLEVALRQLEHDEPEAPRVPRLLYTDATPEALAFSLAKRWPSGGVVSAEAGIVFGAHGMGKESVMRNLALLNVLWDGGNLTIDRRTAESFRVQGVRLTVALQVQEATLNSFFDRSGGLARGTGFLARFLISWPESTQGSRCFTEAPEDWPALAAFNRRVASILDQPPPLDEDGALRPPQLPLTAEAKSAWVAFHDAIEIELYCGRELYDVRDVASKTADNAVRIADLFQCFLDECSAIGLESLESASRIAAWHLNEARRFFSEGVMPPEQSDAVRLDRWLLEYCRAMQIKVVSRRDIQRHVVPTHLRQKSALAEALRELVDAGRIILVQQGKRKEVHVNPALLGEGG